MNQRHVREGETTFVNQTDARVRPFRLTVLVTLVLLVLQYVLGVLANLEVQLPSGMTGAGSSGIASSFESTSILGRC